ncbi:MAG TPA: hypothetical protein ENJ95_23915 [Bacteroidetes bacterium]|nr:hypothetical protein [Bacteroidota bacterium]
MILGSGYYYNISDDAAVPAFSKYTFNKSGNYDIYAYVSERYDDPKPPSYNGLLTAGPVSVNSSSNLPNQLNDPFLNINYRIMVDTNHLIMEGKKNVYALLLKPPSSGHVHFFYNSLVAGPKSYVPSNILNFNAFHKTALNQSSPSDGYVRQNIDNGNSTTFYNYFNKAITYPINGLEDTLDERRLFYVLDNSPGLFVGDKYAFLAVLTSQRSVPGSAILPGGNGQQIIDAATSNTNKILNEEIVGYHYFEQKVLEPNDPNKLQLEEICYCCSDENKAYRFTYKFEFCNDGLGAATGAIVSFLDSLDDFKCVEIVDWEPNAKLENQPVKTASDPYLDEWEMGDLLLEPTLASTDKKRSCVTLTFEAVTNDQGTPKAKTGRVFSARACATLSPGGNVQQACAWDNSELAAVACVGPCPCTYCFSPNWWVIAAAVGIVLFSLFYFVTRRKN